MSNQLAPQQTSLKSIISSDAMKQQFATALPSHLSPDRFARVAITALTRTPKLQSCTQESFFKCLLDLSAMGLEPDGRRAHLIPYGRECTLVLDYKGLVELVRRSGDVVKIHADVVCENDTFTHNMGQVTEHTYDLRKERGEVIAAYAQVALKDGSTQSEIMSRAEIDEIKNKSRAGKSGPWVSNYGEMAKKTAFRRLTKWLTLSPEIMDAVSAAEKTEFEGLRNVTQAQAVTVNPFERLETTEQEEVES
jgi:recombination protein RecT